MRAQQSTLLRIQFLENDIQNYKADMAKLEDANEIVLMQDKIQDRETRIDENKQWLRALETDPEWGKLVETDGSYLPKMPTFRNDAEMERALDNPESWYEEDENETLDHQRATREMVHRSHNELALQRMDGEGPIATDTDVDAGEA